jgi:acyl dehydratase
VVEVIRSRSKPDRGVATLRNETKNQLDETVQTITVRIAVLARSPIQQTAV